MNKYLDKITTAVETAILSKVKSNSLYNEYYNRSDKQRIDWKRKSTVYDKKEIKDWTRAVMAATDPDNPRRGELFRFYKTLRLDLHLGSCIDNRILPIQCAPFKLTDKNGVADTEAHKLLEKPWYIELVKLVCEHTLEGPKLIELFELNDKGELKEVSEIPQSNFIAQKGIIINEEWDTQGVSYKEGAYKDYYIQIGSDWNLGLLNSFAMIILAKKLGLGSWMSYIDKYGVPPVFAITERLDDGRRKELFDMLSNFRSNHFGILQGTEKIEIPKDYNVDAYKSFGELEKSCNDAISKRLLGGTGTTDEKSFVGSAEVHERMLKYRHQVDKLIFKFYFNEEIKPRLVKLSAVYKPLENLYFEWDETETLTLKEILEAIKGLSQYYEFDVEELVKITGLPIIKIKETLGLSTEQQSSTVQKKKPSATVEHPLLYGVTASIGLVARTWDDATEQIAVQIYEGKLKPSELNNDLVLKYYAALNKSAQTGWGRDYYSDTTARKMRDNLMSFSGAKAYNLMSQIEAIDAKSGMSKAAFIEQAKKIVNLHNETYMNVETQFASAKASAARDFKQYVKDIDIYPNLKLRTMEDADVRESHAVLDGLVKPVSEWKSIPPFEPRCRCRLEQTKDQTSSHTPSLDFNAQYANNPALSGKAYPNEHSYFVNVLSKDKTAISDAVNILKQHAPYNKYEDTVGGNKVFINDFADSSDLEPNISVAHQVSDYLSKDIYIRPDSKTSTGFKNPECGIGKPDVMGDLKTFEPVRNDKPVSLSKFIVNQTRSANSQNCSYVIFDLSKATEDDFSLTPHKLRGCLNDKKSMNTKIKNVIIVKGKKVGLIERSKLNGKNYMKHFNDMF